MVPAKTLIPIPSPDPAFIPLMVSGLTASIALEQVGDLKSGEVVMVTGALLCAAERWMATRWATCGVVAAGSMGA